MRYDDWLKEHTNKKEKILLKLKNFTPKQIQEYFKFDNMIKHEKDFCLLYSQNKKCHDIESLNCYFCACPHFIFRDEGLVFYEYENKTLYSKCCIESKFGSTFEYNNAIHQDCTACLIPHKEEYVQRNIRLFIS